MYSGAITGYIDVAQLVLYAFWLFFAGLIYYLRQEDKREGYPLDSDRSARAPRVQVQGFPPIPAPKEFKLADGSIYTSPPGNAETRAINATPIAPWPGAPLIPNGNPLTDGVGPAAYAQRADVPDYAVDGQPRIVPMRSDAEFSVAGQDPDPRGMQVFGADCKPVGSVKDLWVDRSEPKIVYFETELGAGGRRALLPSAFTRVDGKRREIYVSALLAAQFADVPKIANADRVTKLEEDKITAYFAGGYLYATPDRQEPFL